MTTQNILHSPQKRPSPPMRQDRQWARKRSCARPDLWQCVRHETPLFFTFESHPQQLILHDTQMNKMTARKQGARRETDSTNLGEHRLDSGLAVPSIARIAIRLLDTRHEEVDAQTQHIAGLV